MVLAELLELVPGGVEEVSGLDGTIEFAVYGAPGELPRLPDLRAAAGDALVDVSTSEIADDWDERWRSFHRPVLIEAPATRSRSAARAPVCALGIRPPWLGPEVWGDETPQEIVIDPAQAFGTGSHATTRLCLELLLELAASDPGRGPALDIGTGSGVLAIAAARLGFAPVCALDNDRESVSAARTNARENGVELDVRHFDLRQGAPPHADTPAEARSTIVLANLLAPLLLELSRALEHAPAHLIAGGLLAPQADEVTDAFASRLHLRERERRERAGWVALWLALRA